MAILIDSSFYVALLNSRDGFNSRANELSKPLLQGKWGPRFTTDYILDETITTIWKRTKSKKISKNAYTLFVSDKSLAHLITSENFIPQSWEIFETYATEKKPLSFTDCSLIAVAQDRKIKHILSFDQEFDGMLIRIS